MRRNVARAKTFSACNICRPRICQFSLSPLKALKVLRPKGVSETHYISTKNIIYGLLRLFETRFCTAASRTITWGCSVLSRIFAVGRRDRQEVVGASPTR